MLQTIRNRAQGVFAWVIVGLISVPFALWGISNYFTYGGDTSVAKVNGVEISANDLLRAVDNQKQRLREMLGDNYRPELINDQTMRREVLERIIEEQVVMSTVNDAGFRVTDNQLNAEIRNVEAFKTDGKFDFEAYESRLRSQGMTPLAFEAQLRSSLLPAQLYTGLELSSFVSESELQRTLELRDQERDFNLVQIKLNTEGEEFAPSDAELQSYYNDNQTLFTDPERLRVHYLELDADQIAAGIEVSEERLQELYAERKGDYSAPQEWRASHILIAIDDDTDAATAKSTATGLKQQLDGGADFAALAKEYSDDPGSGASGGDLGFFGDGMMVKPFQDAVASMQPGQISAPVESDFGFHIIRLEEVRGGESRPFAEIRDQILKDERRQLAENEFYERFDKLSNLAYENSGTLDPAADAAGIEIATSDWFTRSSGGGVFANASVRNSAFTDDVLNQGLNSEVIEISPTHVVVLRLDEHRAAKAKPLEEVREQVSSVLREQKARAALQSRGSELLQVLQSGTSATELAAAQQLEVEEHIGIKRQGSEIDQVLVEFLFRMNRPDAGAPVSGGLLLPNGDYALIQLTEVRNGAVEGIEAQERESISTSLARLHASGESRALVKMLRQRADVEIRESNL
jgi:peptidyl-prolyl cis-trans isomerase D